METLHRRGNCVVDSFGNLRDGRFVGQPFLLLVMGGPQFRLGTRSSRTMAGNGLVYVVLQRSMEYRGTHNHDVGILTW